MYVSGGGGQPIRREQVVAECDARIALQYISPDCIFVWDFHQEGSAAAQVARYSVLLVCVCIISGLGSTMADDIEVERSASGTR